MQLCIKVVLSCVFLGSDAAMRPNAIVRSSAAAILRPKKTRQIATWVVFATILVVSVNCCHNIIISKL